jgi:hypothetical protein
MQYVFIDTNFFIQYKNYTELPWDELFSNDTTIVIPQTVITEIDNHKYSSNKRIAEKARKFIKTLRQLLKQDSITINFNAKKIHLTISKKVSLKGFDESLDLSRSDDRIVCEILAWSNSHPDEVPIALSGDIGLLMTCKSFSIRTIEIPEAWRLAQTPDEKDKKIKELEFELHSLKSQFPCIELIPQKDIYNVDVEEYEQLTEEEIEDFIKTLTTAFPIALFGESILHNNKNIPPSSIAKPYDLADFLHLCGSRATPPSKEAVEKYQSNYAAWKQELKLFLSTLHEKIFNNVTSLMVSFELKNSGSRSADNLFLDIDATGGLLICPPIDKENGEIPPEFWGREDISLPAVPMPPLNDRLRNIMQFLNQDRPVVNMASQLIRANYQQSSRERRAFYFEPCEPDKPMTRRRFSCIEFRHQLEAEHFDLSLVIPESGIKKSEPLEITICVSASNLPEPARKTINIHPTYRRIPLLDRVELLMRRLMRV